MELEIDRLWGIPAHPLIVHAVVVLPPLAALATILSALVPQLRPHWAPVALVLALAATGAVVLAQGSGEELEHDVRRTELVHEHTEDGERVLPWAIALSVTAAATAISDRARRTRPQLDARVARGVLAVLVLLSAAGATYEVVEVGHSGAKATWHDVVDDD